jgi:hypothetical protein
LRGLASLVGKLARNLLEPAFETDVWVGTQIVAIQVSQTSQQFGWKNGFLLLSEDSCNAFRPIFTSLDL